MTHYFPNEEILIEVTNNFNKRNETTIGYLRNQFNALENYVVAFCEDNNKYLHSKYDETKKTGIKSKFRNTLFDVVRSRHSIDYILSSREVNTLYHFTPLITDDDGGSSIEHERFVEAYQDYLLDSQNYIYQKESFFALCNLMYLVRCNTAHAGKASFGPNRSKIERDNKIAKIITGINLLIFNVIMNHPERKLACYGTLIDSVYTEQMHKKRGVVNGFVDKMEDGTSFFTYELGVGVVDVRLYINSAAIKFTDIDVYEGDRYERIYIPVKCESEMHVANIYERKYLYE